MALNETSYLLGLLLTLLLDRLDTVAAEARRLGIQSIPAFVFENDEIIVGALPPEIFPKTLEDDKAIKETIG